MDTNLLLAEVAKTLPWFFPVVIIILGGVFGSFFNCILYRIPQKISMYGSSFCPKCKHKLGVKDLIPIFSWISTWGHCRYCQQPFGNRYIMVELATITTGLLLYIGLGAQLITFILLPVIWGALFAVLLTKKN